MVDTCYNTIVNQKVQQFKNERKPVRRIVLLIEDEPEHLDMWGFHLLRSGIEAICAVGGNDAIEKFDSMSPPPDIIVMDGDYGAAGDFQIALRHIKRSYDGPVVAASSNPHTRRLQMSLGCTDEVQYKHEVPATVRRILCLSEPVVPRD